MHPETFISLIFIRDLSMALYLGGSGAGKGTKVSTKALCIQKKVIRLITGIKKYES
jgi:hypothetical protein